MKRLLFCIASGILIPIILIAPIFLIENMNVRLLERHRHLVETYFYLFMWPVVVLGPIFPHYASDDPNPHAPTVRLAFFISVVLCDVLVYSLLTYAVLQWRKQLIRYK